MFKDTSNVSKDARDEHFTSPLTVAQIEITGLDGNTGDVAFDLVSFETFEVCAPTWVPYFGVINDVKTVSRWGDQRPTVSGS
ncbi:hypothetical protein FJT64_009643 [Amphibalanus amphitrite]|uniref:Uncharacterized protein n=1 Tax=Amphibalanus amphitrite TaxID=1232801 RepID=A0A6A4VCY3_AMPAM|nr:hypothetical protein FJT64_009643 [Amphibalanus amphitrite]